MSSNEGWRYFEIIMDTRIDELVEGIKKGVERGSSIEQVAQTFVNAGYKHGDVSYAVKVIQGEISMEGSREPPKKEFVRELPAGVVHKEENPISFLKKIFGRKRVDSPKQKKKEITIPRRKMDNKIWTILLIILVVLLILGAITLGVLWSGILE